MAAAEASLSVAEAVSDQVMPTAEGMATTATETVTDGTGMKWDLWTGDERTTWDLPGDIDAMLAAARVWCIGNLEDTVDIDAEMKAVRYEALHVLRQPVPPSPWAFLYGDDGRPALWIVAQG